MLKQTLVFTNPFRLSLRNAQLVIASKEMYEETRTSGIINIWGVIEQKVQKRPVQLEFF